MTARQNKQDKYNRQVSNGVRSASSQREINRISLESKLILHTLVRVIGAKSEIKARIIEITCAGYMLEGIDGWYPASKLEPVEEE